MLALFISDPDEDQHEQKLLDIDAVVSDTKIKDTCVSDPLIAEYVTALRNLLSKELTKEGQDSIVTSKIIPLGKLLLSLNDGKSDPLPLNSYLSSEHWDDITNVIIRSACEASPDMAFSMGLSIRQVNLMQLSQEIYIVEREMQENSKGFKTWYERRWYEVEQLICNIEQWKKIMAFISEHHLADNVKETGNSLVEKMKEIAELECASREDWSEYASLLLAKIRLFNTCSAGTIARMSIDAFLNRRTAEDRQTSDPVAKLLMKR